MAKCKEKNPDKSERLRYNARYAIAVPMVTLPGMCHPTNVMALLYYAPSASNKYLKKIMDHRY